MDISKAIDKKFGVEREIIGQREDILKKQAKDLREGKRKIVDSLNAGANERNNGFVTVSADITTPTTDEAKQWEGWGTCLKPANEPIVVARKPISEKTVADNVLKWGTGGINIDGCRVPTDEDRSRPIGPQNNANTYMKGWKGGKTESHPQGRFPANIIFDEKAGRLLDEQSGISKGSNSGIRKAGSEFGQGSGWNKHKNKDTFRVGHNDSGGASRFFYCAKASKKERRESKHPTVKPLNLMRYLVRLVTPPNGTALDPFAGSGTTLEAAMLEGFCFVGIEEQAEYIPDIQARVKQAQAQSQQSLFG